MAMVEARLHKRLRDLRLTTFGQYVERVWSDSDEATRMVDALSTNVTYFFREPQHFDLLATTICPWMFRQHQRDRRIRIWSAGCSSGEEPYSIAMLLRMAAENSGEWDLRVLATDISQRMLAIARQGVYAPERLQQVPTQLIGRSFTPCKEDGACVHYRVMNQLKKMVDIATLNLVGPWPMKGPFDVIFCRNVMIYFDRPTRQEVVERFWEILAPGGVLFIGHSESLTGIRHRFTYLQPAVYRKGMQQPRKNRTP